VNIVEVRETRWVIPLGWKKISREGSQYKIYLPIKLAKALLEQGVTHVLVYIEAPKEALKKALQGGD